MKIKDCYGDWKIVSQDKLAAYYNKSLEIIFIYVGNWIDIYPDEIKQ